MIGRTAPLRVAQRLLEDALNGRGGSLVFSGEAGIGKTTLLRAVGDQAMQFGFDVRYATGTPSEMDLASAALLSLLLPDLRAGIEPILANALGLERSIDESAAVAAFQIATAFTTHLAARSSVRPLALIVDDVQWVDPSSAGVLALAARRLFPLPVVIVFGRRSDPLVATTDDVLSSPAAPLELAGIDDFELGPLTTTESSEMLRLLGVDPERSTALAPRAGGSPIALRELARQDLSGHVEASINVPSSYADRVSALSTEALFVCSVVALDEALDVVRQLTVLRGIVLDDVISPGLFEVTNDRIRLSHPLLRAAVLRTQTAGERRLLHREIAAVLDGVNENDRYALHRAAGTVGTDDEVAELLVAVATRAKSRGALLESSRSMLRAAELTTDRTERTRRMLRGAENRYFNGEPLPAIEIARTAKALSVDEVLSAEADLLIATAAEWEFDLNETTRELIRLAQFFTGDQPARAIAALSQASAMAFLAGSLPNGIAFGQQTIALAKETGDAIGEFVGRAHVGWNLFLAGRGPEAAEHLQAVEPLMAMLALEEDSIDALLVAQRLSMQHVIEERWNDADEFLESRIAQARRMGVRLSATMLSMVRGAMCWRTGRWSEAYPLVTEDLYNTQLPAISKFWGSAAAAQVTAAMGRDDETLRLVDIAIEGGTRCSAPLALAWAYAAKGHLDLSHERYEASLASFDRVVSITSSMGLREPGFFLWHGDWIETLIHLERFDEAATAVSELRALADVTTRTWAHGVVARTSAQLHDDPERARELFAKAVALFASSGMTFEVARTHLAAARASQAVGLAGQLDARIAKGVFRELGAELWLRQASAIANDGRSGQHPLFVRLSLTERRVAACVRLGKTNRACSDELGMSPRTVEFHLNAIYRKLGVTRRSEFVALLADASS